MAVEKSGMGLNIFWPVYFTYTKSMPSQKLKSSTVTCIEMNAI